MTSEFTQRTPYQGLLPYGELDAPFFFGRDQETRLIIANLFASPLTLLYGVSGVGKSSILRAGVAYNLSQRQDLVVVVFNTWQSNPLADLRADVTRAAAAKEESRTRQAERRGLTFGGPPHEPPADSNNLAGFLATWASKLDCNLLIILDQFEEYFLYHPHDDAFAIEFPEAVIQLSAPLSFLISIREDSYAKLDRFEGRIPALFDNYLRLEHLSREAGKAAIVKPLEQYNKLNSTAGDQKFVIEPELVSTVLDQVKTGQVMLGEAGRGGKNFKEAEFKIETPFLQMVMTRLWFEEMRQGSHTLRLKTLERLGKAERIVRTHLDETMSEMPEEMQEIAAKVFHYLVTPSGTKIAHTIPDLAGYAALSQAQLTPVIEKLAVGGVRILRAIPPTSNQPNQVRYEIFHDVLSAAILDWRARYIQTRELEKTNRRARRLRRIVLIITLIAIAAGSIAIGLSAYIYKTNSVESRLRRAIANGNLLTPPKENAYELYQQLKSNGATATKLAQYDEKLLPLLTAGPNQMLSDLADPVKSKEVDASTLEQATTLMSWASEIKPNDYSLAARAAYFKGRAAYLKGDKEAALHDYQSSSDLDRAWGQSANQIGIIYAGMKEFAQARSYYSEAIRREPGWAVPYNNMGTVYYFEKNYFSAQVYYRMATDLSPQWVRPHLWLATTATEQYDYDTALREYQIAIDLNANSIDPNFDLDRINRGIRLLEMLKSNGTRKKTSRHE